MKAAAGRDARGPDHARVRGDEEDRGGEDADVDLEHAEQPTLDAEVVRRAPRIGSFA